MCLSNEPELKPRTDCSEEDDEDSPRPRRFEELGSPVEVVDDITSMNGANHHGETLMLKTSCSPEITVTGIEEESG